MFELERASCSLCAEIPTRAGLFIKGGRERGNDGWPRREGELVVVGPPVFSDTTMHSGWCLKICPHCGTVYEWEMEYEFLAGGSEDDLSLTRYDGEGHWPMMRTVVRRLRARTESDLAEGPATLTPTRHDRRPRRYATMEALRSISRVTPEQLRDEMRRVGHARVIPTHWHSMMTHGGREHAIVFAHRHARGPNADAPIPTLAMADLDAVSLRGLDLRGADLCGVRQRGGDAGLVDLRGAIGLLAHFEDTCFDGASLRGADFSDATFVRCSFVAADLRGCDLERAYIEGCDFFAARTEGSNLALGSCLDPR